MSIPDVNAIAEKADMIVDGYAFLLREDGISVLNLNHPTRASFFSKTGVLLETSMDDIEVAIIREYLLRNMDLLEVGVA